MAAPQTATARLSMGMPRGVDLSLEKFNLSAVAQEGAWAGSLAAPGAEKLVISGDAFFRGLDGASGALDSEERCRLRAQVVGAIAMPQGGGAQNLHTRHRTLPPLSEERLIPFDNTQGDGAS